MFFSISEIENVVLDLDSFESQDEMLTSILAEISAGWGKVFVSKRSSAESMGGIPVVTAVSAVERGLFQNVIRKAMGRIGAKPSNTVFISSRPDNLNAAAVLMLGTIITLASHGLRPLETSVFQHLPDFLVYDLTDLPKVFSGEHMGYGGELDALPKDWAVFGSASERFKLYPRVPSRAHPDCPIYLAGRYFSFADLRHGLHSLSIRILQSKKTPARQASCFARVLSEAISCITEWDADIITCIPAKPSQDNRLELFIENLPTVAPDEPQKNIGNMIDPKLMTCRKDYRSLKPLGADQRINELNDVFSISPRAKGKRIVLIDDVTTTGSTINEAVKALKAAGAKSIAPIVLGYHPQSAGAFPFTLEPIACICSGEMVARTNSTTGEPFYGCSQYKASGKHSTMSLKDYVKRKLSQLEPIIMDLDEELASEHVQF